MSKIRRVSRIPAALRQVASFWRGYKSWRFLEEWPGPAQNYQFAKDPNPLERFFNERQSGRGIWKWRHYLDIYHTHLNRYRGHNVRVLEIGVYSGGSLEMWKEYFGPRCEILGVDIEPGCKAYEGDQIRIIIGDQSSRVFWRQFKQDAGPIDVVIDDGSHVPEMQIISLEEMLPHLRPGGTYICEDIHGTLNPCAAYAAGLSQSLNACHGRHDSLEDPERRTVFQTIPLQSAVQSVHFYPFMMVVERTPYPLTELVSAKHGTSWQPFLT